MALRLYAAFLLFTGPLLAVAQAVDPDAIDFSVVSGWKDLRGCVQCWLQTCWDNIAEREQCKTNACLCRGSTLGEAIPKLSQGVMSYCSNIDDASTAVSVLTAYCSAKGYTQVVAPTTLQPTGAFTVTVTETTAATVTVTQRVSAGSPPLAPPRFAAASAALVWLMAMAGAPFVWMLYWQRLRVRV